MKIIITKTSGASPKQIPSLGVFDFWFQKIITESFYKFSINIIEVINSFKLFNFFDKISQAQKSTNSPRANKTEIKKYV